MILINVTTNLKLGKPTNEEKYDIKVPNANMDIIDSNIKRLQDADRNFATNENLQAHTERRNNPHEVTKQQIGLDKVVNRQQIYGIPGAVTTGGIPVFDGNGYTVRDSGFTIGKSVPSHAVFTDTTYGIADDNAPGIIKPSDSIRVSSDGTASVANDSHSHDTQYYGKAEAALLHEKNLQDSKKYTDLKLSEHKAEANRIFFLNSNISQSNENSTNKVPSSAFLYSIIQQKNSQIQDLQNEISEINNTLNKIINIKTAKLTNDYFDISVTKCGNICELQFVRNKKEIKASTGIILGNLPDGFRPIGNFNPMLTLGKQGYAAYFTLSAQGEAAITFYTDIPALTSFYARIHYIVRY